MGLKYDLYLSRKPLAGFITIGIAWACYFAQMPVVKANIGLTDDAYGAVMLVSALGVLSAIWMAPLADRWAGPASLPVGAILVTLGFVTAGASINIFIFMAAMMLATTGSGIIDVLINARVAGIEARSKRSLMNLNHGLYSFGYAGSALLTGAAREAGWSPSQIFAVLACAIVGLCFVMWGRDTDTGLDEDTAHDGQVSLWLLGAIGLVVLIGFLAESATEGWSALHIERTLQGGAGEGALGPALLGLTMGFGRLGGHILTRYLSDLVLITAALIISATGIALAAGAQSLAMAYAGFALGGLGMSVLVPVAFALLGRSVAPQARLWAVSRVSALGYAAFFFGPPLMGFVSEGYGLRAAFYMIAVLLLLLALITAPMLSRLVKPR